MFGRRKDMRKKNIARAGAAFVLLLALTGVTILGQDAEATSRAETPRKVASVSKTKNMKKSDSGDTEKKSEEKQFAESDGASSKVEKEKQSEDKKQETANASATATENKSESNSSQNDSNYENENQSKTENSNEKNTESTKPAHEHTWVPQKKGYEKKTLVKEAWTEYKPIYKTVAIEVCNTCGADITSNPREHIKQHMLAGEGGSAHTEYVQKQTGTEEIPHEAEYKTEWIEDIIGNKCSSCGATK